MVSLDRFDCSTEAASRHVIYQDAFKMGLCWDLFNDPLIIGHYCLGKILFYNLTKEPAKYGCGGGLSQVSNF